MMKSAHPDVALWSYERPSRGYFGYHLQARTRAARQRLHQKIATLTQSEPLLLRFGTLLDDPVTAGWARTEYPYLALVKGDVPVKADGVQLAIPEESLSLLLSLLARIEVQAEGSVNVVTPSAHVPLWVWWDAE